MRVYHVIAGLLCGERRDEIAVAKEIKGVYNYVGRWDAKDIVCTKQDLLIQGQCIFLVVL